MPNPPKLMELRPDRALLNSDFDGYKLSLTQIPTVTEQLKTPVDRLVPDINQYSLLHAKLYALHNHLTGEIEEDSVYFVDKELNVQKYSIEALTNQFSSTVVWKLPLHRERTSGDYNVSMKFASESLAVVADGMGYLYVLDRGSPDIDDKWEMIFSGDVTGPDQKFIITDVVYKELTKPQLHLLLTSIKQKEENEKHSTILHWITLEKSDTWNEVALRELTVSGFVQYANLERTCEAIYVISDCGAKFTLDSENEIQEINEDSQSAKKYKWTQGRDDLTIKFSFPENVTKNLVKVTAEATQIKVKYGDETVLEGKLYQRIDPDMTCWTVQNSELEVVLQKSEAGLMWSEVVEGDPTGEFIPDPGLVAEVAERLAPLTSNSEEAPPSGTTFNSQLVEECDFESDKLTILERIDRDSHSLTHKVNVGSHQVLVTSRLYKNEALALGVRSDVDVCMWQPKFESREFKLEHTGSLLAMGYIQASKQQMKFFTCSPDFKYAVICESTKHIFIYCQKKSIVSNELRNRITGRRINSLAQQQVYSVPSNDEILGIHASNSYLYILGESFITALKL